MPAGEMLRDEAKAVFVSSSFLTLDKCLYLSSQHLMVRRWTTPLILVSLTHFDTLLLVFSFLSFDGEDTKKRRRGKHRFRRKRPKEYRTKRKKSSSGKHFLSVFLHSVIVASFHSPHFSCDTFSSFSAVLNNKNSFRSFIIISCEGEDE